MMSGGVNLVMTVIGFAVSTMFIVYVCTRLLCARIQLHASRRAFARASRSNFSILERGLHGIEPVIVANFPTKKYSDAFTPSCETAQCTVCLCDYHKEDILRILPPCGHFFHASCIDIWLHQHCTCPVCRISLRDLPEKKRFMQPVFSSAIRFQHGMQSTGVSSINQNGQRMISCGSQRMEPGGHEEEEVRIVLHSDKWFYLIRQKIQDRTRKMVLGMVVFLVALFVNNKCDSFTLSWGLWIRN